MNAFVYLLALLAATFMRYRGCEGCWGADAGCWCLMGARGALHGCAGAYLFCGATSVMVVVYQRRVVPSSGHLK